MKKLIRLTAVIGFIFISACGSNPSLVSNGGVSDSARTSLVADSAGDANGELLQASLTSTRSGDTSVASAFVDALLKSLQAGSLISTTVNEPCASETWTPVPGVGDIAIAVTDYPAKAGLTGTLSTTAIFNFCIDPADFAARAGGSTPVAIRLTFTNVDFSALGLSQFSYQPGDARVYQDYVTASDAGADLGTIAGALDAVNLSDAAMQSQGGTSILKSATLNLAGTMTSGNYAVTGDVTGTVNSVSFTWTLSGAYSSAAFACDTKFSTANVLLQNVTNTADCHFGKNCEGCQ